MLISKKDVTLLKLIAGQTIKNRNMNSFSFDISYRFDISYIFDRSYRTLRMLLLCVCWLTVGLGGFHDSLGEASAQTYTNPVIHADFSDPDVCGGDEGFWMTASSFQCIPGLPILHSYDLVHWTTVNYALRELLPREVFDTPQHGRGVWAPSIRRHLNTYYIYWGDPDYGVFMVKTDDPYGRWDDPVLVLEAKGVIDTCPLWDDDGRVYLVNGWAASRAGFNSVLTVRELSSDGTRVIGEPRLVYDGLPDGNHTIEGPKFYKRNGYYYILAPAGGVAQGWQVALRSRDVFGPYEARTVMAQGSSDINGPHQGGWVETPQGEHWFLNFQDKGAYGRVVHLNPMQWKNDWPVIGVDKDGDGCGEPVSTYAMPHLKAPKIKEPTDWRLDYQWQANYKDVYGMAKADGAMRIYSWTKPEGERNLWNEPNMWLTKLTGETMVYAATMTVYAKADGEQAGFIVMGKNYSRMAVELRGKEFVLKQIDCVKADAGGTETETVVATLPATTIGAGAKAAQTCTVSMQLKVTKGARCQMTYSTDGRAFKPFGHAFTAEEGKWIGAKIGFYAIDGGTDKGWMDAKRDL